MITNLEQGEDIRLKKRNKGSENYNETNEKGKMVRVNKDRKKRRKLKKTKNKGKDGEEAEAGARCNVKCFISNTHWRPVKIEVTRYWCYG